MVSWPPPGRTISTAGVKERGSNFKSLKMSRGGFESPQSESREGVWPTLAGPWVVHDGRGDVAKTQGEVVRVSSACEFGWLESSSDCD